MFGFSPAVSCQMKKDNSRKISVLICDDIKFLNSSSKVELIHIWYTKKSFYIFNKKMHDYFA